MVRTSAESGRSNFVNKDEQVPLDFHFQEILLSIDLLTLQMRKIFKFDRKKEKIYATYCINWGR